WTSCKGEVQNPFDFERLKWVLAYATMPFSESRCASLRAVARVRKNSF
ncbi:MAG: hypothetical protein V7640_1046, partial [Betaproteobacteria bacterium]